MRVLETRDQIADLADGQLVDRGLSRSAHADLLDLALVARLHEADLVLGVDRAVHDADQGDDAAVGVEVRIEDQRLERSAGIARRRRDALHDGLEQLVDAEAGLSGREDRVVGGDLQAIFDFRAHALGVGSGQVDLVDGGDDLEVGVHGEQRVGNRLRLDALRGVDDEHRALAGGKRAADLVGEVHVARGVDEVELVGLPVVCLVQDANRLRFDRDAALALDVHGVQNLVDHIALGDGMRHLQHAVGQRRLAMVDMGDDREVSDMGGFHVHHLRQKERPLPQPDRSGLAKYREINAKT